MDWEDPLIYVTAEWMEIKKRRLTTGEISKRKSDTAQSCWKLEKGKKVSTVVQYYKCNSGLSSILWSWQSNSESVWTGWRLFMLPSHLITTQSCRIRQGPVFTASYWHYHRAASLLSFPKSLAFLFSGIISHLLLFNIFSPCLLYPSLFQTVSLIKSFLCLGFSLLCSLFD